MTFCASCGHRLGGGRYCTHCGQPVDPPLGPAPSPPLAPSAEGDAGPDTQERRAARRDAALVPSAPRTPPAAEAMPPPPRFPLYADEVWPGSEDEAATRTRIAPPSHLADTGEGSLLARFAPEPPARTPDQALAALRLAAEGRADERGAHLVEHDDGDPRPGRRRPVVAVLLLVLALAAALVVWLVVRDGDSDATTADDPTGAGAAQPRGLAAEAEVEVPGTARPSREVDGAQVTYTADRLVDGDPTTTWRVAGDATGGEIVLRFPAEVVVDRVGLVNGYAKESTDEAGRRFDWYHGHRTITRVVWSFDDGTEVRQRLERDRRLQDVAVDGVRTRTVTLRILGTTEPGSGRAGRDFTAVSELEVEGTG